MASWRTVAILLALAAPALLHGCAKEISPMAPTVPAFPWSSETSDRTDGDSPLSTVALTASIEGLQCAEGKLVLGEPGPRGFVRTAEISLPSSFAGRPAVSVASLGPGEHHIVSYACRNGNNVTYLGASGIDGEIPWTGAAYPQSLASFKVGRNETVIVGALRIVRQKGSGSMLDPGDRAVRLAADSLNPAEFTFLAERHPELGSALTARPMALSPGAADDKRIAKCVLVAEAAPGAQGKSRKEKGDALAAFTGPEARPNACRKGEGLTPALDSLIGGTE